MNARRMHIKCKLVDLPLSIGALQNSRIRPNFDKFGVALYA